MRACTFLNFARTEVLGQVPPDEPAEVRDQHLLQGPAGLGGDGEAVGVRGPVRGRMGQSTIHIPSQVFCFR